jgi:PAT family beta-lactamase induction signal transducer AmpG
MRRRLFSYPRVWYIALLGFSSGLPLALTGTTLQAWFTSAGISLMAIGSLSLIGLPYVWKFLWAPFLDKIKLPFLDRRRGWIALMQLCLCVALFLLGSLNPSSHARWMYSLAVLVAFFSATQDIGIDAYRTDVLLPEERGLGAAAFIFAYRLAMWVSGGIALIMADYWGWHATYNAMICLLAGSVIVTYLAPPIPRAVLAPASFTAAIVEPFIDLLKRPSIWLILLFILLYKIGDALALSLMSMFLLRTLHFSLTEVGLAYKLVGLVATISGAFLGGVLLINMRLYNALLIFGLAQAFSNLLFMVLAYVGKNYLLMVAAIFIENFCSGMSAAAFMAYLTSLCNTQFSATQFAFLSALASQGRVLLGPLASIMVGAIGWVSFYGWTFVLCFPSLFLLMLLRKKVSLYAETA